MKRNILFILFVWLQTFMIFAQNTPRSSYILNTNLSGNGVKQFVARDQVLLQPGFEFTPQSGASFTAQVNPCLLFPPTGGTYMTPNGTITSSPIGAVVGAVPGSVGISSGGGASYTIPIELPAGVNGMQPSLSLVYNSQSGNGLLGYGWSLAGISGISRGGKSIYYDGILTAPQFTNDDRLYMDGQRLECVSGSYLTNGSTYRTDNESYTHISCEESSQGDLQFVVRTKSGQTLYYGSEEDSRALLPNTNKPYCWYLKQIIDPNGNSVKYTYMEWFEGGDHLLFSIEYTSNSQAGLTAPCYVEFYYGERSWKSFSYYAGKRIEQTVLLQSITILSGEQRLYYSFSHDWNTDLLRDICFSKGTELVNPTRISYGLRSNEYIEKSVSLSNFNRYQPRYLLDINGDGRQDMLTLRDSQKELNVYLANGSDNVFTYSGYFATMDNVAESVHPGDFNGDGLSDFIFYTNGSFHVALSNGIGFDYVTSFYAGSNEGIAADYDGDGKTDFLVKSGSMGILYGYSFSKSMDYVGTYPISWGTAAYTFFGNDKYLLDFNGNGITDLVVLDAGGYRIYEFNNLSFVLLNQGNYPNNNTSLYFGDFNGDRKTDMFTQRVTSFGASDHNQSHIHYGNGNNGFTSVEYPLLKKYFGKFFVGNFYGTGKSNLAMLAYPSGSSSSSDTTFYGNYRNFYDSYTKLQFRMLEIQDQDIYTRQYTSNYTNEATAWVNWLMNADFNGDGKDDFFFAYPQKAYYFSPGDESLYVKSITNGMGVETQFTYASACNGGVYTSSPEKPAYPLSRFQPHWRLLSSYRQGYEGNWQTVSFNFHNAWLHHRGKGFLGFQKIFSTNQSTNRISTQEFALNTDYYFNYPVRQSETLLSGAAIATKEMEFETVSSGVNKGFIFRPTHEIQTDHLSGLSSATRYANYDAYGNPQTITTQKGDLTETQTLSYTAAGGWCPNKVTSSTITTTQGGHSLSRTSQYEYSPQGNLLREVLDPDDINRKETIYSNFDQFGHARQINVTANGKTLSSSTTYSANGLYQLSKTDALGQTVYFQWDENQSLLLSETNPKGQITQYEYDGWGNRTKTTYPDGMQEAATVQWATDSSIGAVYYTYRQTSGSPPERIYYNRLGQELMRETEGLNQTPIRIFTEYYPNGRVKRESRPTFSASPEAWAKEYTYDAFGRVASITTPMGQTTYTYNGLTTTVNSPEGTTSTTLNHSGRKASVSTQGKSVTFEYYPDGLIKRSTPDGGAPISFEYDRQGNRTKIIDPDAGTVRSGYDGWGNLLWERQKIHVDQDSILTNYSYDIFNRLMVRNRNGESTTYTYDEHNRISRIFLSGKHEQLMTYDNFNRPTRIEERIGDRSFVRDMEYDTFGRLQKTRYPSGYAVTHFYDQNGFAIESKDNQNRSIWKAVSMNAEGNFLQLKKGEKTTTYTYDWLGLVELMKASDVVDYEYCWNAPAKKLGDRYDAMIRRGETIYYDEFNRFANGELYDPIYLSHYTKTYYDEKGRISELDHWGENATFVYGEGTGKPHALSSIRNIPDEMNAERLLRSISYNDAQKVSTIQSRGHQYAYTYGVDDQKRIIRYTNSNDPKSNYTKYYLGDYEEIVDADGNIQKYHYLSGGDGWAGLMIRSGEADRYYHVYTDYLGSPIAVADENHQVVERYAFNAWGMRRDLTDWRKEDPRTSFITTRGFTGHEHLDAVGLIDMGGRVFDPLTAQFLSPDPYIQAPENWLNYNRYGYCLGNPFRYTDPTGEFILPLLLVLLFTTDIGYELQKYIFPVAVKLDIKIGSHEQAIGFNAGYGVPKILGYAPWKDFGSTYYWKGLGDYQGWEHRTGEEITKFWFYTEGVTHYDSGEFTQDVGYRKYGIPALLGVDIYNDSYAEGGKDRFRTSRVRLNLGAMGLENTLFTGDPGVYKKDEPTNTWVADDNGNDPDKYRHGIFSLRLGPVSFGIDSERLRNFVQNTLIHKPMGHPYFKYLENIKDRFYFQTGTW